VWIIEDVVVGNLLIISVLYDLGTIKEVGYCLK